MIGKFNWISAAGVGRFQYYFIQREGTYMNMKTNEYAELRTAAQDILDGEKPFDEIGEAIDMATASHDDDLWMQARMRTFPTIAAGCHAMATRAIDLYLRDGADITPGDTGVGSAAMKSVLAQYPLSPEAPARLLMKGTPVERYFSLVSPIDEAAGNVISELQEKNPTFRDAVDYSDRNHDIRRQVVEDDSAMIKRRGKLGDTAGLTPIAEFAAGAVANNTIQTMHVILRDMLYARARTDSLPDPEALTARAWGRIGVYAYLSAVPGQLFNVATLGREVAKVKKQNIIAENDTNMIGQTSWLPAIVEYQQTGRIPEYAYDLAPGLLITDEEINPEYSRYGLCAAHVPLLPYATPDVSRPNDQQIGHFFRKSDQVDTEGRKTNQAVAADGNFAGVYDHLTRSIEAASQTIFADEDFRKAAGSMVLLLLKAHNLRR
jgi:hypothetical protein